MPSVNQALEERSRADCGLGGLTQLSEVLPVVLGQYGLLPSATDRSAAGAVVVRGASENRMLADCRLPWDLEVAC